MLIWSILSAWAETSIPIHPLSVCDDWRFPAATEEWVLGCSKKGALDSVWFFDTKQVAALPKSGHWLAGTDLFRVGADGGFWDVQTERFSGPRIFSTTEVAAGRVSENYVAVTEEDSVILLEREQGKTYKIAAKPMGYQLPVIVGEQVAWIEWSADKKEIIFWNWKTQTKNMVPANDPLYLAAEGNILIWSEPNLIQILDIETEEKRVIQTKARGALSIKNGRICWAEWQGEETDIVCSDGFTLNRAGNQFSPIQLEKGLIFHEEQGVMWLSY